MPKCKLYQSVNCHEKWHFNKLVVPSSFFVVNTKIIFGYDLVAPLINNLLNNSIVIKINSNLSYYEESYILKVSEVNLILNPKMFLRQPFVWPFMKIALKIKIIRRNTYFITRILSDTSFNANKFYENIINTNALKNVLRWSKINVN